MSICKMCRQKFDKRAAEEEFEGMYPGMSYSCFKRELCGECAIDVIESQDDGEYFETCERCGREFDYVLENVRYARESGGGSLFCAWKKPVLCCDCIMDDRA